eukprot:365802-Chlamydomonas_euryale.AAC.20
MACPLRQRPARCLIPSALLRSTQAYPSCVFFLCYNSSVHAPRCLQQFRSRTAASEMPQVSATVRQARAIAA